MDASPHTLRALRQQRDKLYQEARANPGSESEDMVRTLVLAGLSGLHPDRYEQPGPLLLEERRRYQHAQRAETSATEPRAEGAEAPPMQLDSEVSERQRKLEEVAKAVTNAQAAAAAGQHMDALQVCNRIAEIVGLRPPPGYGPETTGER